MAKNNIVDISTKVNQLLHPLSQEDCIKVLRSAMALCGCDVVATAPTDASSVAVDAEHSSENLSAKSFFANKAPANKGEMLAVAARHRELRLNKQEHTKEDIEKIFSDARQNFDKNNYGRDLKNARDQAGFFMKGGKRGIARLTAYGQEYVDKLPDRKAASAIRSRIRRSKKKSRRKK